MGPLGRTCEAAWVAAEAEGWAKERIEAVSVAWEAGAAVSAAAEPLVAAARVLSHSTCRRRSPLCSHSTSAGRTSASPSFRCVCRASRMHRDTGHRPSRCSACSCSAHPCTLCRPWEAARRSTRRRRSPLRSHSTSAGRTSASPSFRCVCRASRMHRDTGHRPSRCSACSCSAHPCTLCRPWEAATAWVEAALQPCTSPSCCSTCIR